MSSPSSSEAPAPPTTSPGLPPVLPSTELPNSQRHASNRINHSPRDRIDSILDSARQGKGAMGSSDENEPLSRPRGIGHEEVESSADEETSIVRRGSKQSMNYQATQNTATQGGERERSGRRGRREQAGQEENEETGGGEHESWWARVLSEYGSIELENKGSVARDHLALERTFLAWLRTSLAFASIGIAVTQLFRLNTTSASAGGKDPYRHLRQMGKPLGATFLGISIMILGVGFHRYFEAQHWIIRGKFPASRGSISLVAGITFALIVTSLVVVIVVEPGMFEK